MSRFLKSITALILLLNSGISAAQQTVGEQWLSQFDMTEYHNKVVYLDFWASWCGPCRESFPWLNKMQAKYQDKGLVIIGVNLDRDVNKAYQFTETFPASFRLYSDPKGFLAQQYKITAMPSSYLFSGKGELADKHLGFKQSDVARYEENIVKLLDKLTSDN
ncbi:MAG: cytochrome c biogenesis protein CcmG/thiol:disulfide interchange protein DsbE [Psychromonas sp.]|jgi:cytochrome c biogenesis protein CcmG/thiol:disulfide interchange protein DsbE